MKQNEQVKYAAKFQFEGKSSVFNKIRRNGKFSRAGEHILVLQIIASNKEM